jgi:hypothetical protein
MRDNGCASPVNSLYLLRSNRLDFVATVLYRAVGAGPASLNPKCQEMLTISVLCC